MKTILKTLAIMGLVASATGAFAATDGVLGTASSGIATSTGTFGITATKQDAVQITQMTDIAFTPASYASANLSASDDVCYFATTSNYTVDISSTNDFLLKSGATNSMAYTVSWDDTAIAGVNGNFTANADAAVSLASANRTAADCGSIGSTNASIAVSITSTAYNAAPVGAYTDTVSVVISAV